jgi:CheY-like chemotaxis protein
MSMNDHRLLVIDDELAFGNFVRRVAEDLGFVVQVTTESDGFIAAYDSFKPTIISLDMVMPGRDGLSLVEYLVDHGCTARIIIMTGYNPGHAALAQLIAAQRGAAPIRVLTKPVSLDDLKTALLHS